MSKYSTKVSFVEGFQLSEATKNAVQKLMGEKGDIRPYLKHELAAVVETPNGVKVALPGDYVYSKDGQLFIAKAEDFEAVYELAVKA